MDRHLLHQKRGRTRNVRLASVGIRNRYPAYIEWADFERIQVMLRDNHAEYTRNQTRGVPRDGAALLQGNVWCGQCGHKMAVEYKNANRYVCNFLQRSQGGPLCQHLPADPIDAQVVGAFFATISADELEAWQRTQDVRQQAEDALDRAEAQQVERLRYQALLAERQFNRVDPDNRRKRCGDDGAGFELTIGAAADPAAKPPGW